MSENSILNQMKAPTINKKAQNGILGVKISLKIAFEEFIKTEFESLAQQHEDETLAIQTRFIVVDALLLRPNKNISPIWYEITPDDMWVIISQPVIQKLDQNLLYLFVKLILDTLSFYKKKQGKISIREAEKLSFNAYIEDMERINSKKSLQSAERLKQILYLLTIQYYREGLPILDPKTKIPPSDNLLQKKLKSSFSRVKSKLFSYSNKQEISFKFRIIPYLFQDIVTDTHLIKEGNHAVRIKPAHSFIAKNSNHKTSFAVILISTYFLEELGKDLSSISDDHLDYVIAYEILSVTSSLKFQRGSMEQEIYNIVSSNRDSAEEILYSKYSKDLMAKSKIKINEVLETLIEQKTPTLRVYD